MDLIVNSAWKTLSIMTRGISINCHYAQCLNVELRNAEMLKCHNAECRVAKLRACTESCSLHDVTELNNIEQNFHPMESKQL